MPFLSTIKSIGSGIIRRERKHAPENQPKPQNTPGIVSATLPLPLKPVDLPGVNHEHQFALADQGWTKITYQAPIESDVLYNSAQALFQSSKLFFDLPTAQKDAFKTKEGSEEGWNYVEGEKEFITLRSIENTPLELKEAASEFWAAAGSLLNDQLSRIAESLGLPAEALNVFSEPCSKLGAEKTATMLRLFRYEGSGKDEPTTVAEPHRDLGLLSLVIGDTPGLEVWDRHAQSWFPIERSFDSPAGSVLVGRQLERLSNRRYRSGGHLVRSYPESGVEITPSVPARRYRYSIVFVLRAHYPVPVDTSLLTTPITGNFRDPIQGITAYEFFKGIQRAHFNINTNIDERSKQRENLAKTK